MAKQGEVDVVSPNVVHFLCFCRQLPIVSVSLAIRKIHYTAK